VFKLDDAATAAKLLPAGDLFAEYGENTAVTFDAMRARAYHNALWDIFYTFTTFFGGKEKKLEIIEEFEKSDNADLEKMESIWKKVANEAARDMLREATNTLLLNEENLRNKINSFDMICKRLTTVLNQPQTPPFSYRQFPEEWACIDMSGKPISEETIIVLLNVHV
jgi:hypothetical protein